MSATLTESPPPGSAKNERGVQHPDNAADLASLRGWAPGGRFGWREVLSSVLAYVAFVVGAREFLGNELRAGALVFCILMALGLAASHLGWERARRRFLGLSFYLALLGLMLAAVWFEFSQFFPSSSATTIFVQ